MSVTDAVLKMCRDDRQRQALKWVVETFGDIALARNERIDRFIEEAIELAQAVGMTKERLLSIAEYVYGRPQGVPFQEMGGVSLTFLLLCESHGVSADDAEREELARAFSLDKLKLRMKQNAKAAAGVGKRVS